MNPLTQIYQETSSLPLAQQLEVLQFVEFLKQCSNFLMILCLKDAINLICKVEIIFKLINLGVTQLNR